MQNDKPLSAWTVEDFARHYAETLDRPPNAWGAHISPIFGHSHAIMIAAGARFPAEAVAAAFAAATKGASNER